MLDPATSTAFWNLQATEVLKFISEVIGSLAWPLAAFFIARLFKKQIIERIPGLSELTLPGGISAKFNAVLTTVEAEVSRTASANAELPAALSQQGEGDELLPDQLAVGIPTTGTLPAAVTDPIALQANPTGVVMESWKVLEEALRSFGGDKLEFQRSGREYGPAQLVARLANLGMISRSEVETLRGLIELRNLAAHSSDRAISELEAKRFKELAEKLALTYQEKAVRRRYELERTRLSDNP